MADLATVSQVETAWRPLTAAEQARVAYLVSRASRLVLRRWPDTETRIANGDLASDDVADVVIDLVLSVVGPPVPGARSWQVTSGSESRSVSLGELADAMAFSAWMVEVFEGRPIPAEPVFCAPAARAWPDPVEC